MEILIEAYFVVKTLLATLEAYYHFFFHLRQISSQIYFRSLVTVSFKNFFGLSFRVESQNYQTFETNLKIN